MSVASHCRFDLPCAMVGAVCAIEGLRGAVAVVNGSTACKYLAGRVVEVQDPFGPRLDPRWPGCFGQTRVPCTNIDQEDIIFGMEGKGGGRPQGGPPAVPAPSHCPGERLCCRGHRGGPHRAGRWVGGGAGLLHHHYRCARLPWRCRHRLAAGHQGLSDENGAADGGGGGINIIGPSLLHGNWANDLAEIRRLLAGYGVPVNCVLAAGSDLDQVESLGRGLVNVVLAPDYGLDAAGLLEERLGVPTLKDVPLPYGIDGTDGFLRAILEHLGRGQSSPENKVRLLTAGSFPVWQNSIGGAGWGSLRRLVWPAVPRHPPWAGGCMNTLGSCRS